MEKSQNRKPFQALRDLFHPVDLTHGTCWRTILQFSLPVILSYLLQQVYTISDAAIVGQTLTAQEVAGVNDTSSLVFIFLQFAFGVSAGFCVITSCCVGCRDQAGVRRSMAAQLVLSAGRRALRPAAWRHGRREVRTEAGAIPPGRGAAWRQKNAGRLAPPAGHDWTKKMRGGRFVPPRLPLQRIPDIPLFGVVVRNVLDAGQFHMLLQCGDCLVYGHVFRDRRYGRIVIQKHDRTVRRRMAPPAQCNEVMRVCP